jgi:hypothetical protein
MKLLPKAALAKLVNSASHRRGMAINFAALQAKAWPYCTGKYKRTSIVRDDHDFTVPVWYESRIDTQENVFSEDRSYIILRCVNESRLTPEEFFYYEIAKEAWNDLRPAKPANPPNVIPFTKPPRISPERLQQLAANFSGSV